jgi:hypothetical protein
MDTEQTIAEIEWLERIFSVPDTRPPSARDLSAANRRHDERLTFSFVASTEMNWDAPLAQRTECPNANPF